MNGHVSYIYTLAHTYTSGRAGAGQADWNYQARPWALSTNFQRKQILDATLIFPFNTDQESSWHICSLPMIQFASDLSSHPTLSFSRLQSVKVTQRCASKLIKRKGRKNFFSLLPEFIKVSPAGGNHVDNGIFSSQVIELRHAFRQKQLICWSLCSRQERKHFHQWTYSMHNDGRVRTANRLHVEEWASV